MIKFPSPDSKTGRVLKALMTGESYNLFEAESDLHDRSLHSTVSTLQNKHGIKISRAYEYAPGFGGTKTRCCRYWIDLDERMRILIETSSDKEKALTTSDETIGKGLDTSTGDDCAGGGEEQVSLLSVPVKYVRECFRAIARF